MAIKYTCDICGSEDDVRRCLSAEADLCGKHHVEFHDAIRSTQSELLSRLDQKRLSILSDMKTKNSDKTRVVPIR